jgi:hypothetical protein
VKKKKKQIRINHIERASAVVASLQGRLRENQRRGRKGKKHRGVGEEPQHHHNTRPEQYGVENAEWERRAIGGSSTCMQCIVQVAVIMRLRS